MEGDIHAIELQGIVRNATKIAVDDGQCEDLINLRFKDGSWRTSGEGKFVFSMGYQRKGATQQDPDYPFVNEEYTQLYVHTNVYRHILGVINNTLYWFANIDPDGVFEPLTSPKSLCQVEGDITITQTGNLLTIISKAEEVQSSVAYALFDTRVGEYKLTSIDENGSPSDRILFPYGNVHFNLDTRMIDEHIVTREYDGGDEIVFDGIDDISQADSSNVFCHPEEWHAEMLKGFKAAKEKNIFTRPFLAMIAVKLYDGTYVFASEPVLLWPREKYSSRKYYSISYGSNTRASSHPEHTAVIESGEYQNSGNTKRNYIQFAPGPAIIPVSNAANSKNAWAVCPIERNETYCITDRPQQLTYIGKSLESPVYAAGITYYDRSTRVNRTHDLPPWAVPNGYHQLKLITRIAGSSLLLSIDDLTQIFNNPDLFTGIGVFVTREVPYYKEEYKKENLGQVMQSYKLILSLNPSTHNPAGAEWANVANISYEPKMRDMKDIRYDLEHSPFFLLRDFTVDELNILKGDIRVDLSDAKYKGILANIEQSTRFEGEAFERKSYIPKVAYSYNGRLHLANYASTLFHGYPAEAFTFNNHSGQADTTAHDFGLTNYKERDDGGHIQFPKTPYQFMDGIDLSNFSQAEMYNILQKINSFVAININLPTNNADAVLTRYIAPHIAGSDEWYGIEDFPALLSYPDRRAKSMEIVVSQMAYVAEHTEEQEGETVTIPARVVLRQYKKTFPLEAHTYFNMAYYMSETLEPISIADFDSQTIVVAQYEDDQWNYLPISDEIWGHALETNVTEYVPNGLKVSAVDNPLSFPYKNTYQVGSSEIIAICSNAIAVGTGQTGTAPLFVFCKDGVYALMVDASGEITYSNARVIARDVCNNPRSVTPLDMGIAFTTARGLMLMTGEQVEEYGQPAEGDVLKYTDATALTGRFTPKAFPEGILTRIASLPESINDNEDFLQYISGALVHYNHNLRELIVSNPNKGYSYVCDSEGRWERRSYSADEYVNNYPTSYRVHDGAWYKVDEEEGRNDEAQNKFFIMSRALKLGSIGFKQATRFVTRGQFDTATKTPPVITHHDAQHDPNPTVREVAIAAATDSEISDASSTAIFELPITDAQTITVPTGKVAEMTIQYPSLLLKFMKNAAANFDVEATNKAIVSYRLADSDGNEVFRRNFESVANGDYFSVDLTHVDDVLNLSEGTYTAQLVADSILAKLIDERPDVVVEGGEESRYGLNTTVYTTQHVVVSQPIKLDVEGCPHPDGAQSDEIIELNEGEYLTLDFHGIVDYVCDLIHTTIAGKVCKFIKPEADEEGNLPRVGRVEYRILKWDADAAEGEEEGEEVYHKRFDLNYHDDYTLRCQFDEAVVDEDSSEETGEYQPVHETVNLPAGNYIAHLYLTELDIEIENVLQNVGAKIDVSNIVSSRYINGHSPADATYFLDVLCQFGHNSNIGTFPYQTVNGAELVIKKLSTLNIKICSYSRKYLDSADMPRNGTVRAYVCDENGVVPRDSQDQPINQYLYLTVRNSNGDIVNKYQVPFVFDPSQYGAYGMAAMPANDIIVRDQNNNPLPHDTYTIGLEGYVIFQTVDRVPADINESFDLSTVNETENKVLIDNAELIQITSGYSMQEYYLTTAQLNALTADERAEYWDERYHVLRTILSKNAHSFALSRTNSSGIITNILETTTPAYTTITPGTTIEGLVGAYIFGSYDGRNWALLGFNRREGTFTDIGCTVERTDMKFFRFVLAGHVKGNSRLDYLEMAALPSVLNTKIR